MAGQRYRTWYLRMKKVRKLMPLWSRFVFPAIVWCGFVSSCLFPAHAGNTIRDGFEARGLSDIWNSTSAPDNRVSFRTGEAREGRQSLALVVRSGDIDESCKCQRTEIRESTQLQPEFGSDVWYRFSLKITNLNASLQTTRWKLG